MTTSFRVAAKTSQKMHDVEKGSGNYAEFFPCNICLDLAKEPIVTSCGHLFCWPCIYRWLNVHSSSKKCPVCKGDVILKNVTPIYGRGNNALVRENNNSDPGIPSRPQSRRIENLRETLHLNEFSFPVEEMLRRVRNKSGLIEYLAHPPEPNNARREQAEITTPLLRRFMTPRAVMNELNFRATRDNEADLVHNNDGRGGRNQEHPPPFNGASRPNGDYRAPRRVNLD